VFGGWVLGFALALLLRTRIPLTGLWRALLLLPWVIPIPVTAAGWQWLFMSKGSPVLLLLHHLGFGWVDFFDDPTLSRVMVFTFRVWLSFPFMFLLMSSALASVDRSVYEAARADGASAWQIFTRITLPMTSRTTYIAWLLMAIMCVNDYPSIELLTGGGPGNSTQTLMVLAWDNADMYGGSIGGGIPDATAIGFLMTIVLVAVSLVLYRRIQKVGGGLQIVEDTSAPRLDTEAVTVVVIIPSPDTQPFISSIRPDTISRVIPEYMGLPVSGSILESR
jgi:multiple sugar transport system permease protein